MQVYLSTLTEMDYIETLEKLEQHYTNNEGLDGKSHSKIISNFSFVLLNIISLTLLEFSLMSSKSIELDTVSLSVHVLPPIKRLGNIEPEGILKGSKASVRITNAISKA